MFPELSALTSIFLYLFLLVTLIYVMFVGSRKERKNTGMDRTSMYLLIIGGLFILFSIISPGVILGSMSLKSADDNNSLSIYSQTGPLGDTLGGVMNPFISIAGVIITGLAFYAQYKANQGFLEANEDLKKQFKIQQFESQFYEMLHLHKENVNEMSIEGYNY